MRDGRGQSGGGRRFSHLTGRLRMGAAWFEERSLLAGPSPKGLVNRIADLAHDGLDVERIHPDVVPFFERTADLELHVRSAWRFPLSWLWPLFRPFMRLIGQFVLPASQARIDTRVMGLDADADGRPDARAVVRTYAPSGDVFQVVAYATHERGGTRYMSAAFPMPLGQIAGFLRLDPVGQDADGRTAVALTSARRDDDDAGVHFVMGSPASWHLAFRAPLAERLELWPAGMDGAPAAADDALPGATIVGRHEQRLFGFCFVVHHYAMRERRVPETGRTVTAVAESPEVGGPSTARAP